jgi:type I restriction enzyme S subunit
MSFPAYPEYKDSGVPWLGKVPAHWSLEPLRGQFIEHKAKNEGAQDQNYLSLVAGRGVMPYAEKGDMGNKKPDDLEKCKRVKSGNFVINSMNFGIGAFGVSAYDGVCSPVYVVLEPSQPKSLRFLRWIFDNPGFREVAQSFGNGILAHRAAIGWDELKAMWIGVPPLAEQAAIAAFLDRETAKIDALVAEQERLIALLKEKRQAVISHAVTKGLNPHAPMKDSGVPWLGEVPAHWDVSPLKRRVAIVGGSTPKSDVDEFWDGDIPWITPADLSRLADFYINDAIRCITDDGLASCGTTMVPAGSVILSTRAPIGSLGIAAVDLCTNQGCKALVPKCVESKFLAYVLSICSAQLNVRGRGSTFLELSADELGAFPLPFPSKTEQTAIAAFLDRETAKIDALVAEAQAAITLLQERRAALISAAVTGKIDVRGLVDAPADKEAA